MRVNARPSRRVILRPNLRPETTPRPEPRQIHDHELVRRKASTSSTASSSKRCWLNKKLVILLTNKNQNQEKMFFTNNTTTLANSSSLSVVCIMTTRVLCLYAKYAVGKKMLKINSFFSHFFSHCPPQKKNLQEKRDDFTMILALLCSSRRPSRTSLGFGRCARVYLPGVAPQGADFLSLFVSFSFFFARVLNGV